MKRKQIGHLSPSHLSCPSLSSRSEYLAASADWSATPAAAPSFWDGDPADSLMPGPGPTCSDTLAWPTGSILSLIRSPLPAVPVTTLALRKLWRGLWLVNERGAQSSKGPNGRVRCPTTAWETPLTLCTRWKDTPSTIRAAASAVRIDWDDGTIEVIGAGPAGRRVRMRRGGRQAGALATGGLECRRGVGVESRPAAATKAAAGSAAEEADGPSMPPCSPEISADCDDTARLY
ncbi:hypothetical protein THAOC_14085 [Thalassiosira oceanica]|uniref:Uncharacterized protein n=1 Tax=Thalassiosira oceanica TaxID=159749 RepID=K0SIB3_THAOC|nr:hypothetical protein THAOC_14085 [Thalassiosira oceanica]|eukprot:EJK65105.1 hypothetical protein THAOC_14085 [Thalassiosira oceanica]